MEYAGLPRSLSGRNLMLILVRDQGYGPRTMEADSNRHHWSRRSWQGAHCQLEVRDASADAC